MLILEWRLALMAFALGRHYFRDRHVVHEADGRRLSPGRATRNRPRIHISSRRSTACARSSRWHFEGGVARNGIIASPRRRPLDTHLGLMANYPQTLSLPFERLIYSGCMAVGAYMVLDHRPITHKSRCAGRIRDAVHAPGAAVGPESRRCSRIWPRCAVPSHEVAQVMNTPRRTLSASGLRSADQGRNQRSGRAFQIYRRLRRTRLKKCRSTCRQGTMLGIMGRSGSGKTTVTRLLQRLHTNL